MMAGCESAWLHIAAAGSSEDDGRFFMPRNQLLKQPCRLPSSLPLLCESDIGSAEWEPYAFFDTRFFARAVFQGFLKSQTGASASAVINDKRREQLAALIAEGAYAHLNEHAMNLHVKDAHFITGFSSGCDKDGLLARKAGFAYLESSLNAITMVKPG
jgi:hypothetical protein